MDAPPPPPPSPVVFILNTLPPPPEDDFPLELDEIPTEIENLVAVYHQPLLSILESSLNTETMVRRVYINFGDRGCCEVQPYANVPTVTAFENVLNDLFATGTIFSPDSGEVTWQMIPGGMASILEALPTDACILGCTSGPPAGISFHNLMGAASDDRTFVFVVGELDDETLEGHIDSRVKVSEQFQLEAGALVARIVNSLEGRWNIP